MVGNQKGIDAARDIDRGYILTVAQVEEGYLTNLSQIETEKTVGAS